eukprot:scaffold278837_cov18-Tisochrysis_lutea.AAC.1
MAALNPCKHARQSLNSGLTASRPEGRAVIKLKSARACDSLCTAILLPVPVHYIPPDAAVFPWSM